MKNILDKVLVDKSVFLLDIYFNQIRFFDLLLLFSSPSLSTRVLLWDMIDSKLICKQGFQYLRTQDMMYGC